MTYPKHLFRSPGPYRSKGRAYDVAGASSEAQERALIERGWHPTREEAWGGEQAEAIAEKAEELSQALDEITPPTRAELEQKAEELHLPFNARTKDETLAKRIAEALGEEEGE